MALFAHYNLKLYQMDVNMTFLNGNVDETIYMVQLEDFVSWNSKNMVFKFIKSIYGLKKTFHQWYRKFHEVILSFCFEVNDVEDCVYHKFSGNKYIFLIMFVDDIQLVTNDICMMHETKKFLSRKLKVKDLGDASFVLGIQIHRDWSLRILGLSQMSYIEKVLERFDMQECKPWDTPVTKGGKFSPD